MLNPTPDEILILAVHLKYPALSLQPYQCELLESATAKLEAEAIK